MLNLAKGTGIFYVDVIETPEGRACDTTFEQVKNAIAGGALVVLRRYNQDENALNFEVMSSLMENMVDFPSGHQLDADGFHMAD